ncbi:MAG: glypican [Cyanobium sp.]
MAPITPPKRSLPGALVLTCTVVGALVLGGILVLALAPVLIGVLAVGVWLGSSLLLAWLGIEAMAALERWFETDPRFQR